MSNAPRSEKTSEHYIGLMSGTSLDGVDAALITCAAHGGYHLENTAYQPFDTALRTQLLALSQQPAIDDLETAALVGIHLAQCYAKIVHQLLSDADLAPTHIQGIGCHGQTVRHRPEQGFSIQLGNPALLAELTGITVVADFRSRDIAAGGQGAPLVPAFHQDYFSQPPANRVIVNIGGISNITYLTATGGATIGFDCGPGNLLLDAWTTRHLHKPYDQDGAWAAQGKVIPELLSTLQTLPFFHHPPPKSTGRETFNLEWLDRSLERNYTAVNVQATLLQLTADVFSDAIHDYCPQTQEAYLCGGGAHNSALRQALAALLPGISLALTDERGIAVDWVEAFAFAWLARQTLHHAPGNLPAVTGARHHCILGAIYLA